ncbi:MAG: Fe-S cluster assembly protein SufD [Candidatus Bipolaricaulia bacterium]
MKVQVKRISREAVEALSDLQDEPEWLRNRRVEALAVAEELPLPETRYTKIRGFHLEEIVPYANNKQQAALTELEDLPDELRAILAGAQGGLLVQIDSEPVHIQLPTTLAEQGVIFTDMNTAIREHLELVRHHLMVQVARTEHKFTALHEALFSGGALLYVPQGVEIDEPIYALYLMRTPHIGMFNHTLIIAEPGSRVTYLEETESLSSMDGQSLHTAVAEVYLGAGAEVTFGGIQNWGPQVYDFVTRKSQGDRGSQMRWTLGWLGSKLTFSKVASHLAGPGARAEDLQIFFGGAKQHFDLTSNLRHEQPHTVGEVTVKGILKDRARSVFNGLIRIEPGAQGSNAYQAERAMILNSGAKSDAIPALEIEADDVRATHAASASQMDAEQIFYLKSRGLNDDQARKMIVDGFFEPTIQLVPLPVLRERIRGLIDGKWNARPDR